MRQNTTELAIRKSDHTESSSLTFERQSPARVNRLDSNGLLRRLSLIQQSPLSEGFLASVLMFLASIFCAYACYVSASNAFRESFHENIVTLVQIAAQSIDPEEHARLVDPEQLNSPEYLALVEPLRAIVKSSRNLDSIFTLRPTREGFRFIVDTSTPEDFNDHGMIDHCPLGMIYDEADASLIEAVRSGQPLRSLRPYTDSWGTFVFSWVPVLHKDGRLECMLGFDLQVDQYRARQEAMWHAFLLACGLALLASLTTGGALTIYLNFKRESLRRLADSEQRYALIMSSANEGIWDWNLCEDEIYVSDQIKDMLCTRTTKNLSSSVLDRFFELIHPDDRSRVLAAIDAHLQDQASYNLELRMQTPTGSYRWFQVRGQAIWNDQGQAVQFVGSLVDVNDRVQLRRQLRRAARIDRLTRLPNRTLLLKRLRRVLRTHRERPGSHFALLYLDFDRFKVVNDSLGHEVGDMLLVQIASRIRKNLRQSDGVLRASAADGTAARIGGDEFVVLLEGLRKPEDAISVAHRLLKVLAEPYQIQSYRVLSTASIGIVMGDEHYDAAEDLLRDADTAMYEAKTSCRGSLAVFDETMRRRVRRKMQLEQGLRAGIPSNQLDLVYQPIVSLNTGKIISYEVLSRWVHPELGRISPDEFIPLAEECGLIVLLGERMIERSLEQLVSWRSTDELTSIPGISVNLSRHHLLVPDLVKRLLAMTERSGVIPADLHIEITEGAMIQDVLTAHSTLHELREAGFQLAIDDFGTGYSSLSCLHEFPFDLLKIDQSFIRGIGVSPSQTAILRSITSLASALGFRVVAEGIETAEQLTLLRELGCDYGQGYYFARPVSAEEIPAGDFASLIFPKPRRAVSC